MINLLLIEDDKIIQNSISYYLSNEGFNVEVVGSINEANQKLNNNTYDLILLDVTLPDGNGFEFIKKIENQADIPVIFLTALDEENDIVNGFNLGAYDYITKPFHAGELLSRIKNVLRLTKKIEEQEIQIENIKIKTKSSKVYKDDTEIELTALEYRILLFMFKNKGKIISRGQILANIWDNQEKYVNDNTLTVYIKRVREKIEKDINNPKIIKTIRGLGYKIG